MSEENPVVIKKSPVTDLPQGTTLNDTFRGYVKGKLLSVIYPSTQESLEFNSGIIDSFSDNFSAKWSKEESYGRMDYIANYSNTQRSMSVSIILIAESETIAQRNMAQMSKLSQFMYPTYEGGAIKDRPLIKIKMMNLIQDAATGGPLLGFIESLDHSFDLKEGAFFSNGMLFPKFLTIKFNFSPLHSQRLGFVAGSQNQDAANFHAFPYSVKEKGGTSPAEDMQTVTPAPDDPEREQMESNLPEVQGAEKVLSQQVMA